MHRPIEIILCCYPKNESRGTLERMKDVSSIGYVLKTLFELTQPGAPSNANLVEINSNGTNPKPQNILRL